MQLRSLLAFTEPITDSAKRDRTGIDAVTSAALDRQKMAKQLEKSTQQQQLMCTAINELKEVVPQRTATMIEAVLRDWADERGELQPGAVRRMVEHAVNEQCLKLGDLMKLLEERLESHLPLHEVEQGEIDHGDNNSTRSVPDTPSVWIHADGKCRPIPRDWELPKKLTVGEAWNLWVLPTPWEEDEDEHGTTGIKLIRPLRSILPTDLLTKREQARYREWRSVFKHFDQIFKVKSMEVDYSKLAQQGATDLFLAAEDLLPMFDQMHQRKQKNIPKQWTITTAAKNSVTFRKNYPTDEKQEEHIRDWVRAADHPTPAEDDPNGDSSLSTTIFPTISGPLNITIVKPNDFQEGKGRKRSSSNNSPQSVAKRQK